MSEEEIPERYQAHPLYAILENYILDTIGQLEAEKVTLLSQTIARVWGGKPQDWKKTVRTAFDLPADTDEKLEQLWKQRQEEATHTQEDFSPLIFARQTVDENYADIGGRE